MNIRKNNSVEILDGGRAGSWFAGTQIRGSDVQLVLDGGTVKTGERSVCPRVSEISQAGSIVPALRKKREEQGTHSFLTKRN
jgi:hypothetical protein